MMHRRRKLNSRCSLFTNRVICNILHEVDSPFTLGSFVWQVYPQFYAFYWTFTLRQIITLEQDMMLKWTNLAFFSFFNRHVTIFLQSRPTAVQYSLVPPLFFLFPRTPSPLMIHRYHPPTRKANPALTSLHAPLCYSRRFEIHIRNAQKNTRWNKSLHLH